MANDSRIESINDRPSDWNSVDHWKNMSLHDVEGEVWKDILGFAGYYKISNMGRVKSLKREGAPKERMLGQRESDERGYVRVPLTQKSHTEHKYVQIIVGQHFIDNPERKRTVNHKWGNKKDNRASSLEWNTYSENHQHSYAVLGRKSGLKGKTGYASASSKEVLCVTNGKKYGSVSIAAKELKLSFQNISKVCKGVRNHTGGLVFKFTEEGEWPVKS